MAWWCDMSLMQFKYREPAMYAVQQPAMSLLHSEVTKGNRQLENADQRTNISQTSSSAERCDSVGSHGIADSQIVQRRPLYRANHDDSQACPDCPVKGMTCPIVCECAGGGVAI
jgi:hypothetical protein